MMEGLANGSSSRCSTSGISVSAELAVIRAKSFRHGARMLGLIKRRFIEPDCKSGDGTGLYVLTGPGELRWNQFRHSKTVPKVRR